MTYGRFLLLFLVGPILVLLLLVQRRLTRSRRRSLFGLMAIALLYTTPWDNLLVAQGIWWYDPAKVLGLTLAWVPLEEYLFFLLQPLLTGLLLLAVLPLFGPERSLAPIDRGRRLRVGASVGLGLLWVGSLLLLALGGSATRYLGLELAWALPPLILQAAFGADLIARRGGPAVLTLLAATITLLAADVLAIRAGIWTIDPLQTLGWNPLSALVLEEAVFFGLTNALIIGGLTLLDQPEALARWRHWRQSLLRAG